MKNILLTLFATATIFVVSVLGATTASATTISGTTGDCTWTLDGTVLTISGNGEMGSSNHSDYKDIVTKVVIENGVTSIDMLTFAGFSSMTSVEIPNSVTHIGAYAFYGCSSLTSIHIPESVTSIGDLFQTTYGSSTIHPFLMCSRLEIITVAPENSIYYSQNNCLIETRSKKLISGCQTSIIPEDIECIGDYAFNGCTELKSIHIPASVYYEISPCTFSYCSNLESITVSPDNPYYSSEGNCLLYGSYLIRGCKASVIPDNVRKIGELAFSGCSPLSSINIPDGVTSIGKSAFIGCSSLTSITIPANVTNVGDSAFEGCENLKTVYIHSVDVAKNLSRDTSCGHLGYYADTIYVASNIVTVGNHIATMPYKTEGVTVNGAKYTSYWKVSNHTCSYE